MTNHYASSDAALEEHAIEQALLAYADDTNEVPGPAFADWIMRTVAAEPIPRRGPVDRWWALLVIPGPNRRAARGLTAGVVLVAGIGTALAIEEAGRMLPELPATSPVPYPTPEPTPSLPPQASTSPSPSPTSSHSPTPLATPTEDPTPIPSATADDDEGEGSEH